MKQTANVIRRYVAYTPGALPRVDVLAGAESEATDAWEPGELRMETQHEDGSWTCTVQFAREQGLLVHNVPGEQVRRHEASHDR